MTCLPASVATAVFPVKLTAARSRADDAGHQYFAKAANDPTAPLIAFQLDGGYASSIYQTDGSRSFVQLGAAIHFEQGGRPGTLAVTAFESFNLGLDLGSPVSATCKERRPFAFYGANTTADAALR